ncbi:MAG UNVERIFIED_CONTAM: response regulator [Thermobifida fusca]
MRRLLLVEDNPDLRRVLADYLHRTFDVEVTTADGAIQARAAARTGPFSAVILDFLMDGASAAEVAADVRSTPGNDRVPVVLLTAFDPDELARSNHPLSRRMLREIRDVMPSACLVKPFPLEALRETMEGIVPTLRPAAGAGEPVDPPSSLRV